ncbi:3-oxoacyl-ACP synthase III family protein [Arcticibacter sp. MXS-1]|uniref:3-oxoacyl-ACP synthase III family protein n=1 Tax=Arcticibacter sp. MXS-1 TaxID=3341726 RepID=UPI0035A952D8
MKSKPQSVIVATGSYIPETVINNEYFLNHSFYDKDGVAIPKANSEIIRKFKEITGIEERRYAASEQTASDLGLAAAANALESSGIDKESLDYIIVAHNFGDVRLESNRVDIVPTLASRIKQQLKIENPDCIAYDLPFGCPGWVQALIQADYFIRSGDAKRCLVIGTETLSRIIDPHDRDSLLYGDGAGAAIIESSESGERGIITHKTRTYALDHAMLLAMAPSYSADYSGEADLFVKMNGRKLYEFAITNVPLLIKDTLDKAGLHLSDISKVLIHQANEKMDQVILDRLFKMYGMESPGAEIMPMSISWLGNSSVATVPTLLDLISKGKMEGHEIKAGDKIILASVGAGMNINAVIYQA